MIGTIRRRGMMAHGGGGMGYITDGLVLHLDGIDKGTTDTTKWVDLVGGLVWVNDGAVRGDTYWQFNNTSTYYVLKNTDVLSFGVNSHTIEVCYDSTKNSGLIFAPKTNNVITLGLGDSTQIVWNTGAYKPVWQSTSLVGVHAISVNKARALQDLTMQLSSAINDYFGGGAYNGIGGRSTNTSYQFNGKIYAIRIYNRLLSYDEMQQNQRIDNERFGLGLTI